MTANLLLMIISFCFHSTGNRYQEDLNRAFRRCIQEQVLEHDIRCNMGERWARSGNGSGLKSRRRMARPNGSQ